MTMVMEVPMEDAVSKSRFKAHALVYFRQVEESGRPLVVTDRGRPVLRIVPFAHEPSEQLAVLKESVVRYDSPFEPIGVDDWDALK